MKKILWLIALIFLWTTPAFAAISFVQSTSTSGSTIGVNATSASFAFASNVSAGDLIIVFARWQANALGTTSTINSVTDSKGDTYTEAFLPLYDSSTTNPAVGSQVWYALNVAGGATTSTVNFSTSTNGNGVRMALLEASGIATTSAIDNVNTQIILNGSTTFYSGTITTNNANDLLVGGFAASSGSHNCTAGTTYTKREPNGVFTLPYCMETSIVSATGTYQATGTYSAASDFAAYIIAFKAPVSLTPGVGEGVPLFQVANSTLMVKWAKFTIDN